VCERSEAHTSAGVPVRLSRTAKVPSGLKTAPSAMVKPPRLTESPINLECRLLRIVEVEETGLILQVGAWALRRAALDHRRWTEAGLDAPRVAVNVSAIQVRQRDFVRAVEAAIRDGAAPPGIDLEITESLVMEDVEGNIEKLRQVRALGVDVAIDDFGTGYSSLAYLAKLPVQTLKIDRSFVITMLSDPDTMTLVQTIVSLAHSLRLKVVAEGVDEEAQAQVLRRLGCDEMQGYLFSRPVPADRIAALLARSCVLPQNRMVEAVSKPG